MPGRSDFKTVVQVGLIKEIAPLRGVIVGGKADTRQISIHCSWNKVLIEPVIVTKQRMIANIQLTKLVIKYSRDNIYSCPHTTLIGIAKEGGSVCVGRSALERGDTTVGNPRSEER